MPGERIERFVKGQVGEGGKGCQVGRNLKRAGKGHKGKRGKITANCPTAGRAGRQAREGVVKVVGQAGGKGKARARARAPAGGRWQVSKGRGQEEGGRV